MIAEVPLNAATRDWLVKRLIDWGYLDASACIEDEDDENDRRRLGYAIGRALPRLVLEAERQRVKS
jgi:hypothetical protein